MKTHTLHELCVICDLTYSTPTFHHAADGAQQKRTITGKATYEIYHELTLTIRMAWLPGCLEHTDRRSHVRKPTFEVLGVLAVTVHVLGHTLGSHQERCWDLRCVFYVTNQGKSIKVSCKTGK